MMRTPPPFAAIARNVSEDGRPRWDRRVMCVWGGGRENMCMRKCHVSVDMYIKSYGMPHALDLEVLNQPLGIEFDPP